MDRGGYIDNVPGSFTTDPAINPKSAVNIAGPATYEPANNDDLVEDNFNDSGYQGIRLGLRYFINDE